MHGVTTCHLNNGRWRRCPLLRARLGLVPSVHSEEGPCNVKMKTGRQPSGRFLVWKDSCWWSSMKLGRLLGIASFAIKKWVSALSATPTGLQSACSWCLQYVCSRICPSQQGVATLKASLKASFLDLVLWTIFLDYWMLLKFHGQLQCNGISKSASGN